MISLQWLPNGFLVLSKQTEKQLRENSSKERPVQHDTAESKGKAADIKSRAKGPKLKGRAKPICKARGYYSTFVRNPEIHNCTALHTYSVLSLFSGPLVQFKGNLNVTALSDTLDNSVLPTL